MGDHGAVDITLGSHETVLEDAQVLTDESWIRSDRPHPDSVVSAAVAIDDLAVQAKVPKHSRVEDLPRSSRPDLELFDRAEKAYEKHGFEGSPSKERRGLSTDTQIGIEIQGREGVGGAPRSRVMVLSLVSMLAAGLDVTTPYALEVLSGTWTSVLLPRRPLLVTLHHIYRDRGKERYVTTRLRRCVANELALCAVLAPLAAVDMRCPIVTDVFATDASPYGGAFVRAPGHVSREVAKEM